MEEGNLEHFHDHSSTLIQLEDGSSLLVAVCSRPVRFRCSPVHQEAIRERLAQVSAKDVIC